MLIKHQRLSFALGWTLALFVSQTAADGYCFSPSENSIFFAPAQSVSERTALRLQPNETVKTTIARDELQLFAIDLSAGQYAEVEFEWEGINLSVALLDPTGTKLFPTDVQVTAPG